MMMWRRYAALLLACLPLWAWADEVEAPVVAATADVLIPGEKAALTISLANPGDDVYNGYQFDLRLPEGITLAGEGGNYDYTLSDRYSTKRSAVVINDKGGGHYRLMCYSLNNTVVTGNDGPLITLYLHTGLTGVGHYEGTLSAISLSAKGGNSIGCPRAIFDIQVELTIMGDVNIDHAVDVTDVMKCVNDVLRIQQDNFHSRYADMDSNGVVDVSDIMVIVNIILHKQ